MFLVAEPVERRRRRVEKARHTIPARIDQLEVEVDSGPHRDGHESREWYGGGLEHGVFRAQGVDGQDDDVGDGGDEEVHQVVPVDLPSDLGLGRSEVGAELSDGEGQYDGVECDRGGEADGCPSHDGSHLAVGAKWCGRTLISPIPGRHCDL